MEWNGMEWNGMGRHVLEVCGCSRRRAPVSLSCLFLRTGSEPTPPSQEKKTRGVCGPAARGHEHPPPALPPAAACVVRAAG